MTSSPVFVETGENSKRSLSVGRPSAECGNKPGVFAGEPDRLLIVALSMECGVLIGKFPVKETTSLTDIVLGSAIVFCP